MKQYVALFEQFEEEFDDFYQKPDTKSDTFYQQIANSCRSLYCLWNERKRNCNKYQEWD